MKAILKQASVVAILLLLAGCNAMEINNLDLKQVGNIANQLSNIKKPDQEKEVAIGRESTAILLGALGDDPIYQNDGVQRYVNLVGRYIASLSDRPDLKWRFVVSDDPDFNAFAAPGGYVVVTLGLLAELENEAQLAAVLAHEIVHVEQKHHLNILQANKYMSLASDTAMLVYTSQEDEPKLDPRIARQLLMATRTLYSRGLDKEDEFNADSRAITLLVKAGYDPYALVDVLQKLDATSVQDSKLALLLKTHPSPRTRLEKISGNMPPEGWPEGKMLESRFFSQLQ